MLLGPEGGDVFIGVVQLAVNQHNLLLFVLQLCDGLSNVLVELISLLLKLEYFLLLGSDSLVRIEVPLLAVIFAVFLLEQHFFLPLEVSEHINLSLSMLIVKPLLLVALSLFVQDDSFKLVDLSLPGARHIFDLPDFVPDVIFGYVLSSFLLFEICDLVLQPREYPVLVLNPPVRLAFALHLPLVQNSKSVFDLH